MACVWYSGHIEPNQFLDFVESVLENVPSSPVSGDRPVPMPRALIEVWAGVPKEVGCWEGWRFFLDFLKSGILMGADKKACKALAANMAGASHSPEATLVERAKKELEIRDKNRTRHALVNTLAT